MRGVERPSLRRSPQVSAPLFYSHSRRAWQHGSNTEQKNVERAQPVCVCMCCKTGGTLSKHHSFHFFSLQYGPLALSLLPLCEYEQPHAAHEHVLEHRVVVQQYREHSDVRHRAAPHIVTLRQRCTSESCLSHHTQPCNNTYGRTRAQCRRCLRARATTAPVRRALCSPPCSTTQAFSVSRISSRKKRWKRRRTCRPRCCCRLSSNTRPFRPSHCAQRHNEAAALSSTPHAFPRTPSNARTCGGAQVRGERWGCRAL